MANGICNLARQLGASEEEAPLFTTWVQLEALIIGSSAKTISLIKEKYPDASETAMVEVLIGKAKVLANKY